MDTPGITVSPLNLLGDHDINAVFFDDVRGAGRATCVGGENDGWRLITNQLNHERVTLCASGVLDRALTEVTRWAQETQAARRPPGDRPGVGAAQPRPSCTPRSRSLRLMNWQVAWEADAGRPRRRPLLGGQGVRHRAQHGGATGCSWRSSARCRTSSPTRPGAVLQSRLEQVHARRDHPHLRRRRQRDATRPDLPVHAGLPEG